MPSLGEFSKRIAQIGVEVEENVGEVVRKVALAVDQTVVMATPVDTGRARSNWIARLGSPAQEMTAAYAPGKSGSTGGANAQAAMDQASREIAGYDVKANPAIYISNNLPYIGRLNDGYSPQAGAHYVQQAAFAGAKAVQGAKVVKD